MNSILGLLGEASHGVVLKVLGFAGRAIFLFIVAPGLVSGQLTQYVFLMTVAGLFGRFACFGLEEHLPLRIQGDTDRAATYFRLVDYLVIVEIILATIYVVTGRNVFATTALLAACYVVTPILGATLKTIRVAGSERLRDLHWVLFGLITLTPFQWNATDLLGALCASMLAVQFLEFRINALLGARPLVFAADVIREMRRELVLSWPKIIASLNIVAIVRGLILWPKILRKGPVLDEIAFVLLLGEAVWQAIMVIVHRKYARYSVYAIDKFDMILTDVISTLPVILVTTAFLSVMSLAGTLLEVQIGAVQSWPMVAISIAFFGQLAAYMLIRYAVWATRQFDWRMTVSEVLFFGTEGVIVMTTPIEYWVIGLALFASVGLAVAWRYARRQLEITHGGGT